MEIDAPPGYAQTLCGRRMLSDYSLPYRSPTTVRHLHETIYSRPSRVSVSHKTFKFAASRFRRRATSRLKHSSSVRRALRVEALEDRQMLATFTVTNLNNAGSGSLRAAIEQANNASGRDQIVFAAGATSGTIALTTGELEITDSLTITGPGQEQLAIDGQHQSRVLNYSSENGTLAVEGLTIRNGQTSGLREDGGGILFNSRGLLKLNNSTVSGNSTAGDYANGGGISGTFYGNVELTNSTVSGNATAGRFADGGGIYTAFGEVSLFNSTVSDNRTLGGFSDGGGIATNFGFGDVLILINSTVSGNKVAYGNGGGIFTPRGITLTHSTVTDNEASTSGGIHITGGISYDPSLPKPLTISGSIIARNASRHNPPDLRHAPYRSLTVNNSLIGDVTGISVDHLADINNGSNNLTNVDPLLGPLADNGGPVKSHALLPGSPALDAIAAELLPVESVGQSTTSVGDVAAENALDGDLSTYTQTTASDDNPTWHIVAGRTSRDIYSIVLHNRTDGFRERLRDIRVQIVGESVFTTPLLNPENVLGSPATITIDVAALNGGSPVSGKAVLITREPDTTVIDDDADRNTLSLAEVQIYVLPLDSPTTDQRNLPRVGDGDGNGSGEIDIGAYEAQSVPSADFVDDNVINGADFIAWQRGFGISNATRSDGNSDDDNDADASDLAAWQVSFQPPQLLLGLLSNANILNLAMALSAKRGSSGVRITDRAEGAVRNETPKDLAFASNTKSPAATTVDEGSFAGINEGEARTIGRVTDEALDRVFGLDSPFART